MSNLKEIAKKVVANFQPVTEFEELAQSDKTIVLKLAQKDMKKNILMRRGD